MAFSLPSAYVDGVRAGGGLPILLPPGEVRPAELLDAVDGLVFGGGGDLHPRHHDGDAHDTNYFVDAERDDFELELMRAALDRRIPILAICRGLQVLNVARGGGLHAHLPDVLGDAVTHRVSQNEHAHHRVRLAPDSHLAELYGTSSLRVASWHHQAVSELGEGLRAVGWAEDGGIEALEDPTRPDLLAVQWHPELQLEAGSAQVELFRKLSQWAEKRR
jgi:putative glutamine amidotransferase